MVRNLGQVNGLDKLPGATIIEGDFNNAASLDAALQGIDKAFLLTNSSQLAESQQKQFVDAAKAAGVSHIVKLSQWAASARSPYDFCVTMLP
ncbi:NAD(P)H-binding protein [Paraflavitalea speifideaquila]|uniref:NmrA family NAD(P)-binding protein n=1 Tax=Paraflavitalea speifideaquila TaxID=3076558 RepID=UPI0028EC0820|nr:NAD(P)H-binding protein [Paraflavitalea speifideiaquila]